MAASFRFKRAEYFLVLWLITCIFTFTLNIKFPVKLNYFTGSIGMVVLGYYLRHTERKIFNNVYVGIILTVVPAALMILISYLFSSTTNIYYFSRYSIFLAIESMGLFIVFKTFSQLNLNFNFLTNPNGIFKKSVSVIAKYSYGIYLIHQVIMCILFLLLIKVLNFKLLAIVLFVGGLGLSILVLALLNRVPHVKNYIGAK